MNNTTSTYFFLKLQWFACEDFSPYFVLYPGKQAYVFEK